MIVILGVLAGIVVFAVGGLTDRGEMSAAGYLKELPSNPGTNYTISYDATGAVTRQLTDGTAC